MKITKTLLTCILCAATEFNLSGGVEKQLPVRKIEITGQAILTDNNGVVIPKNVLELVAGVAIKIKRIDGVEYQGVVTEVEESEGLLKIFGVMLNSKKTHFGFVAVKGGQFVGAIVDENKNETYVMEYIQEAKGFVFIKETAKNKQDPKA